MPILLTSIAFLVAAICAGLMGYAIQRGATCTVAAMDELVRRRSVNRLAAMVEASLWVLGGLLLAQGLHVLGKRERCSGAIRPVAGGIRRHRSRNARNALAAAC